MAQVRQDNPRRLSTPITEDNDKFDRILVEAYDKQWWREFITMLTSRQTDLLNDLISGKLESRKEDQLRGRVQEITFIINLDTRAKFLRQEKERRNGE